MESAKRIETRRLTLLPSSDERDLDEYLAHLTDPREFFMQFGRRLTDEVLGCVGFHGNGVICYSAFSKATGEMVGYVGLMPYEGRDGAGELEYHIFREHRGKGYCTEASSGILGAFFDGTLTGEPGRIAVAKVMFANGASTRVLEKLGFEMASLGVGPALNYEGEHDPDSCVLAGLYELEAWAFRDALAAPPALPERLPKAS